MYSDSADETIIRVCFLFIHTIGEFLSPIIHPEVACHVSLHPAQSASTCASSDQGDMSTELGYLGLWCTIAAM